MAYWENGIEGWSGQETVLLSPRHYNLPTLVSCRGGYTPISCHRDQFIIVPSIISSESFARFSNPLPALRRALSYPECFIDPKPRWYCWRWWPRTPLWLALLCLVRCNRRTDVGRGGVSCGPAGCASPPPLEDFLCVEKKLGKRYIHGRWGEGGVVDQRILSTHGSDYRPLGGEVGVVDGGETLRHDASVFMYEGSEIRHALSLPLPPSTFIVARFSLVNTNIVNNI